MSAITSPASHVFTGVPSFFGHLIPYSSELDEWHETIHRELEPLVEAEDDAAVLTWLVAHFPRCMALVPKRRRGNFVRGFYEGFGLYD